MFEEEDRLVYILTGTEFWNKYFFICFFCSLGKTKTMISKRYDQFKYSKKYLAKVKLIYCHHSNSRIENVTSPFSLVSRKIKVYNISKWKKYRLVYNM